MKDQDLYCHYSDLPSPAAYVNHNNTVSKKKRNMKRAIIRFLLWWSFRKVSRKKTIWDIKK
jgi:hypothetical protein